MIPQVVWLLLVLLITGVGAARSQDQPQWISLDGSPPGTAPTLDFLLELSSSQESVFNVTIHGFWSTDRLEQGQLYQELALPECGHLQLEGRPELPVLPVFMSVPTDTQWVSVSDVTVLETRSFPNRRVWPAQAHAEEYPDPPPEIPFTIDDEFYQTNSPYPQHLAARFGEIGSWRQLRVQHAFIHPFQAVPAQDRLLVRQQMRVTFAHPGAELPPVPATRRMARAFAHRFDNMRDITDIMDIGHLFYSACYLFLIAPQYETAIEPLVDLKRSQGYRCTVWTTDDIGGGTCADLQAAVADWHDSCPYQGDGYVLLVGEHDELEMCTHPDYADKPGDHMLGSLDGDLYQEVGIGRLSVDDETDCAEQVAKIIRYETAPTAYAGYYRDVVLAAHPEEGRGYIESAEEVADWPYYPVSLVFKERYGDAPDGTVANVVSDVDLGPGLVAYRGHGGSTSWAGWDYHGSSLYTSDVRSLSNGSRNPLVFAICCNNNSIDTQDDCIGEVWMEGENAGSVCHYGASRGSNTCHNNELLPSLFRQLYDDGNPNLWEVTQSAQFDALGLNAHDISHSEKSIVQYFMLGTIDLKFYQGAPYDIVYDYAPDWLDLGYNLISIRVVTESGAPLPGAIVALYKDDEVQTNGYSDADGWVSLEADLLTDGQLTVTAYTDFDGAIMEQTVIPVGANVPVAPAARLLQAKSLPNPFNPQTRIEYTMPSAGSLSVKIYNTRGQLVRILLDEVVEAGSGFATWNGTDADGRDVAAGVYLYEVRSRDQRIVNKVALVK